MKILDVGSAETPTAARSLLDDVFSTSDEEVGTFMDVIGEAVQAGGGPASDMEVARKIVSGKPDKVVAPKNLEDRVSGFVRIFCGWHGDDYVWHLEPAAIRRPWRVSIDRVIYAIAKTMHPHMPPAVEVKIWKPQSDWEMKTVTFKAIDLKNDWSITEKDLAAVTEKLFVILNTLV